MKKLSLLLFTCIASFNVSAGSVYINNWQTGVGTYSCYRISNVSDVSGEVNVKFYTSTGAVYSGALLDPYLITSLGTPFTVPAKHTARFCLNATSTTQIGYGRIDTSPVNITDGELKFIAHGNFITPGSNGYAIQINNGMPF